MMMMKLAMLMIVMFLLPVVASKMVNEKDTRFSSLFQKSKSLSQQTSK